MKTLIQLQNEVKTIKAENKKAYDEYYTLVDDIDNKVDNEEITEDEGLRQDAELRIKLKLSSLDAKYRKAIDELKEYCYKEFSKNCLLNDEIKFMFTESKKRIVIENKLVDFLLTV